MITGAGSGIERALSQGFSASGVSVVGFGRRADALGETAATCPGMVSVVGCVTSREDAAALVSKVFDRFGRIDALIKNAGENAVGQFLARIIHKKGRTSFKSLI